MELLGVNVKGVEIKINEPLDNLLITLGKWGLKDEGVEIKSKDNMIKELIIYDKEDIQLIFSEDNVISVHDILNIDTDLLYKKVTNCILKIQSRWYIVSALLKMDKYLKVVITNR